MAQIWKSRETMGNMGCWLEKNARIVRFADGCPLLRGWISMVYCLQLGQWAGIQTENCPRYRLITWYTVYTPLNQGRTPKFPQVSQKWTWSFWLSMLELWARRTWSVQAEPWGPSICSDLCFFPQFPTFPNWKPRSCRVSSPDEQMNISDFRFPLVSISVPFPMFLNHHLLLQE